MNLEKLDMTGCRGDERALERKIWKAVRESLQAQTRKANPQASRTDIAKTVQELRAKAGELAKRIRALEEALQALRSEAAALRERADRLLGSAPRAEESPPSSESGGAVTQVDIERKVVVINLGAEDGVKPGTRLLVRRGDRYVATIQIRAVRKGESEAVAIKVLQKDTIRVGDRLLKAD